MTQETKRNGLVLMTEEQKPKTKRKGAALPKVQRPPGRPKQLDIEEIKNLEEPIHMPTVSKPKGRPKNANYLSYEEAREFIRGELIPSRRKFHEWYDRHKPKSIPRFPYRVYKEWVSWNDFLGTNNKFTPNSVRRWRSLDDAIIWVHRQQIESYPKWIEFCKTHGLPEDIPTRPDLVYNNWRTWNHWLGNTVQDALEAQQKAVRSQVFFIIHEPGVPENVLTFNIETEGLAAFKERFEHEHFNIVKMFWYDPDRMDMVKRIIEAFSTPYLGLDKTRICPNVWEIVYHIQSQLETIIVRN